MSFNFDLPILFTIGIQNTVEWFFIEALIAFVLFVIGFLKKNELIIKPLRIEETCASIPFFNIMKPTLKLYLPRTFTLFVITITPILFIFINKEIVKYLIEIKTEMFTKIYSNCFHNDSVLPITASEMYPTNLSMHTQPSFHGPHSSPDCAYSGQSHNLSPPDLSEATTSAHSRQSPASSLPSLDPASTSGQSAQCPISSPPCSTPASTCAHSLQSTISKYPGSTPASTSAHSGQSLSPSSPDSTFAHFQQSLPSSPPCSIRDRAEFSKECNQFNTDHWI